MFTENQTGQSAQNTHCSSLDNTEAVPSPATIPVRLTLDSASEPGSSETPLTQSTLPAAQETPPNGMSCVRGAFSRYNFSEEVTDVLLASWRSGTQKQYQTYLNKWMAFCGERKIAYYSPPLNEALQFLVRLFNQGLSYSALNIARSALSAIIITEGGESFGTNCVVTRFMKGVFESQRPKPKYMKIWDVAVVLKHLSTLYPYNKLALKDLTYKVLMLILLVSSQRGQTVRSLDLKHLCVEEDKYIFDIDEHMKTSSPRNPNTRIEIARYEPDVSISPFTCLKAYIDSTKVLRKDETKLFVSYVSPHRPVSRDTISRWTKKPSTFVGWIPKCSLPIALGQPPFQKPVPKMSLFTRSWPGLAGNPKRLFINITIRLLFKKTVWPLLFWALAHTRPFVMSTLDLVGISKISKFIYGKKNHCCIILCLLLGLLLPEATLHMALRYLHLSLGLSHGRINPLKSHGISAFWSCDRIGKLNETYL